MATIRVIGSADELVTLTTATTTQVEIQVVVHAVPDRAGRPGFNGINISSTGTITADKARELIQMLKTAIAFAEGDLKLPEQKK